MKNSQKNAHPLLAALLDCFENQAKLRIALSSLAVISQY